MSLDFTWTGVLIVEGTSTTDTADALTAQALATIPPTEATVELDLFGLDIDSGGATVAWHETVRRLRDHFGTLVLVDAPQMLAHSLYKVGDLADGRIRLVDPRTDEGITAN